MALSVDKTGAPNRMNPLLVNVKSEGVDRYTFSLRKDAGRNLGVVVVGSLARDGISTYVMYKGRLSLFTLTPLALTLSVWAIISLAMGFLPFAVLGAIVFGGTLSITLLERRYLYKLLGDTLGKYKAK